MLPSIHTYMGQNLMCPHSGIPTPSRIMSSPTVHCKGTNSFGLKMSCYLLDLLAAFFPVQLRSKSAGNTYFLWKKTSTYKKSYSLFGKKNGQVVGFSHQRWAVYGLERNIESVKAEHPSRNLTVLHMTQ